MQKGRAEVTNIRQIVVIERETRIETGYPIVPCTRQVAACAILANPYAARRSASDSELTELTQISVEVGAELTARALERFPTERPPIAYSKGVIVGIDGDREHGAAMIHARLGLAMRQGLRAGPALIPGTKKVAQPGAAIDLIFGGAEDAWNYDAMDAMEVSIPGAPRPDEIVLIVAFATARPNARTNGASPDRVAEAMRQIRGG
jgi:hypothetical protein